MNYVGSSYSVLRPNLITYIFVGCDVASIATQGIGSAVLFQEGTNLKKLKSGRVILIAGLFIQIIAFAVFLAVAAIFDRKSHNALKLRVAKLRPLMNAFYISGALILLRSIYRVVGTLLLLSFVGL